ncbi:heme exporter protein CcmD [Roseateles sp. BYS87W]|uniref:Heme exporter protein D n=1 Tax=Pelomonas baiyunensis TaxID=3299026 RepID=A0ABW7H1R3_9BURK
MSFTALSEALALQGYGIYVWPAYAVMAAALLFEPWWVCRRKARARRDARHQWRATQWGADGASAWGDTRPPGDLP